MTRLAPTYAFRLWSSTRTPKPAEVERILASYQRQLERFQKRSGRRRHRRSRAMRWPDVDAAEQAAWTLVANALLNLDEALTKE